MLGISHETNLSEQMWMSLPSRAVLPRWVEESLEKEAEQQLFFHSRRLHARKPLRSITIASLGENRHACYAKDISRMGIGFYSPINILPKKIVTLSFPGKKTLQLSITRCRRLDVACFECGGTFQFSSEIPRPYISRTI